MSAAALDAGTTIVVARIHPLPGQEKQAEAAVTRAAPGILAEEGCEYYAPHRAADGTIVIVEKWSSRAALEAHSTGEAVGVLRSGLQGLTAAATEVTALNPLDVAGDGARL
ncbi:antibiotic biosynthesis monooxygenase [Microbacterium sp. LRZ72]|uniref:putative quinol monooxygenase n=1 Tax=Microbacterium sp. LRZ72 TaxID=2942481 RepID=UPI0029BF4587|nr:putative quinol monooxygenase [Microbacterium sp. LRZ72]MDX2377511.1 antibiotic biosynthesis monooxygenase [Microbacterium sp. LRZ72]